MVKKSFLFCSTFSCFSRAPGFRESEAENNSIFFKGAFWHAQTHPSEATPFLPLVFMRGTKTADPELYRFPPPLLSECYWCSRCHCSMDVTPALIQAEILELLSQGPECIRASLCSGWKTNLVLWGCNWVWLMWWLSFRRPTSLVSQASNSQWQSPVTGSKTNFSSCKPSITGNNLELYARKVACTITAPNCVSQTKGGELNLIHV